MHSLHPNELKLANTTRLCYLGERGEGGGGAGGGWRLGIWVRHTNLVYPNPRKSETWKAQLMKTSPYYNADWHF